jgi:hypothetical protein
LVAFAGVRAALALSAAMMGGGGLQAGGEIKH